MRPLLLALTLVLPCPLAGQTDSAARARSLEEMRHLIGVWDVTTEFLNPDGSVRQALAGTYRYEWVTEDKVAAGQSGIPALGTRSALVLYLNDAKGAIELVSVGPDGKLWVMSGAYGSPSRTTEPFVAADGSTRRLRFTRSEVTADRFVSRMEWTQDEGRTWVPGNRQVFRRR